MGFSSNLTIRQKLLLGFSLIGLIFVASSMHSLYQISTANEITRSISAHDVPTWNAIMEIKIDLVTGHLWFQPRLSPNW